MLLLALVGATGTRALKLGRGVSTTFDFRPFWYHFSFSIARSASDCWRANTETIERNLKALPGAIVAETRGRIRAIITAVVLEIAAATLLDKPMLSSSGCIFRNIDSPANFSIRTFQTFGTALFANFWRGICGKAWALI